MGEVRSKLTITSCAADILTVQLPVAPPLPVPAASHPAPAHAFRKLPEAAVAVSVTLAPVPKDAEHPVLAAAPLVIAQLIAAGEDVTLPLPPAPPEIRRGNDVAGRAKAAVTVRGTSSVTSHEFAPSATPVQPAVQVAVTPVPVGVAVSVRVVPVLNSCEHLPLVLTTVPVTVTTQLIPPRLEVIVPPAVLPVALTESDTLLRSAAGAEKHGRGGLTVIGIARINGERDGGREQQRRVKPRERTAEW